VEAQLRRRGHKAAAGKVTRRRSSREGARLAPEPERSAGQALVVELMQRTGATRSAGPEEARGGQRPEDRLRIAACEAVEQQPRSAEPDTERGTTILVRRTNAEPAIAGPATPKLLDQSATLLVQAWP
jgi:hypothetical protein